MKNAEKNHLEDNITSIRSLSHDGRGIATHQHKKIFITGALPDETVQYRIKKKQRHYFEGAVDKIIEPSPVRTLPVCNHFDICGGCSLQHMQMPAQLNFKQDAFLEQLQHFGRVQPQQILPPLTAETEGYRRKARLGVKFVIKKNKLMVGFREKQSNYLTDIQECPVLHPTIGTHLTELNALIASLSVFQHIPQVEVAIGDQDAALIFRHMQPFSQQDQDKLIDFGKSYHFDIYLQPTPPLPLTKIFPNDNRYRLTYTLPDYALTYTFHPLDFTQVNLNLNRLMVKHAIQLLELNPNDIVLDLFSGIGNFTLPMAKLAHQVIGVEGSLEMVKRGYENAALNQVDNVKFYADNLMLPNNNAAWAKYPFTKILLDPPRAGAREILPVIQSFMTRKIVYISCNPATLARDAGDLVHQYGYTLTHAGIMNMFPHTSHTESIAVFEKN